MHKIIELVANKSAMPADWITNATTIDDLAIESLDFVELIFEIETEFDVKIPTDWDADFTTIGDLIAAIDRLQNSETPVSG